MNAKALPWNYGWIWSALIPAEFAVEECTKPTIYMQSKLCDSSPELSAIAHVITDSVVRELSSCSLHAFKRSKNVLPSLDHTQVWKSHVWACLSCLLLLSLSIADSASLSAQHKKTSKSWIPSFKGQSLWWFLSIFGPDRDIYFPDYDSLLTLGWKWIFACHCVPTCLESNLNSYNYFFKVLIQIRYSFMICKRITTATSPFIEFNKGTMYNAMQLSQS